MTKTSPISLSSLMLLVQMRVLVHYQWAPPLTGQHFFTNISHQQSQSSEIHYLSKRLPHYLIFLSVVMCYDNEVYYVTKWVYGILMYFLNHKFYVNQFLSSVQQTNSCLLSGSNRKSTIEALFFFFFYQRKTFMSVDKKTMWR